MSNYLNSTAAAARLGVSRQTLYAYVSRGLLRAEPGNNHRESRYLAADVERLADQRARGRKPKEVAKAALNWGLPVLESSITLIDGGRLFYRGVDALDLAARASLEEVAALLWRCDEQTAFGRHVPTTPSVLRTLFRHYAGQRTEQALLPLFTVASEDAPTAIWHQSADRQAQGCGDLVRILAACLLRTRIDTAPIHAQCARAWGVGPAGAELIRMALVLCADHELNASSFTGRCIASTNASLRAVVVGGLAGLSGERHGATTARGEALWDELGKREVEQKMGARLARGDGLPGFGHALYPDGDVRATYLLSRILPRHPQWKRMIDTGSALVGQKPSLDLALVALRRHLRLPVGAAFGLFALGRSIGWIAHGLEQREQSDLIRPRAVYTGAWPDDAGAGADHARSRGRSGKQQTTQPAAPKDDMLAAFFRRK
ncbi:MULTISPECIES: citrate synthase family protein [Burkholderia]|uniref:citrate synthase (unknown stereospecificity) n=1 Tax=Burkholderia contaminans TaxID=488447 RepID=A0A2S5E8V8_9BURK|nr:MULTISPECIES: citrate synthase family protein [Burkholderia]EKS9793668.1 citrate synthase family protein [Burkholderia cepacia]EKS9801548.1 citrate synthase family protein [Burkholderia cepacia]EKS9808996.1 citrate synthase family protein [Burkholderia cepacia]EKS9821882.1 citrate synthase family protein [Burkholderia cepacia]EKS9825542.1 citrate synthase family protein [Burkholderia cepacia]